MKGPTFLLVIITCILLLHHKANSQVLHTENFNVIIDTTKVLKGNFTPSLRFRNLKEDFLEISNTADLSVRIKNHGLTVANKLEYSFLGKKQVLSGGFIYIEYVNLQNKKITFEPFFQMHWNEVRGLNRKYAGGINLRLRALVKENTALYFGIGSLYEFERWNYSGVSEANLPPDQSPIEVKRFRGTSYISYKQKIVELFDLDIGVYYQPAFIAPFKNHRLAASIEVTYNITQHLGLRLLYQNIYDHAPVVPIDKLYHDVNFGVTISF